MSDNIADPFNDQRLLEQIHTPLVAEIVNQLVFVPESFFDEERKAIAQGAKMWHEFIRRFAESKPIGPGDPIEFLDRSIRAMAVRSQSTATLAATIDERVEFARRRSYGRRCFEKHNARQRHREELRQKVGEALSVLE